MKKLRNGVAIENWRKSTLLVCIFMMLAGMMFSRFLLTSFMGIFIFICLAHKNIFHQLRIFFASPFLLSMTLLFIVPFVSGLWSENIPEWSHFTRIKLPLLLLPVCFPALTGFSHANWRAVFAGFILLMLAGVAWSLGFYFHNPVAINRSYLEAQTIETPLGNDHVRFSLLVSISILSLMFFFIRIKWANHKYVLIAAGMVMCIFVFYLHLLAVRTGLVCFYLGSIIFLTWLLVKRVRPVIAVSLLLLLGSLPVLSYRFLPSFRNRLSYIEYDLSQVRKNVFLQGSNDGDRAMSIRAGWQLMNAHPVMGVGFGDIEQATKLQDQQNFPGTNERDEILPSSEWMMYGSGAGWPGFVVLSFSLFIPFFLAGVKKNIFWFLLNFFIAASYLFDIGLEVQFGVFIHAFILLSWHQWMQKEE